MPLTVQALTSLGSVESLLPEWRELERSSGNGLPFLTGDWAVSWWRHFAEDTPGAHDNLSLFTLRDAHGRLVAVAPLMLTQRPGWGPLGARKLQFMGADPNISELRGMLCAPEVAAQAYAALCAHLHREGGWDWLVLSGVPRSVEWADPAGLATPLNISTTPCYLLRLGSTWEEFRASRKPNVKEALRKCYRSLEREGLEFRFDVAHTSAQVQEALDDFFVLHGSRAALTGTVLHRNVFAEPRARCFLRDVCGRLAEQRASRVFTLRIGGRAVAQRIGFVLGDTLYLYYSGFDPAWGRYSVMTTTVAESIKYAIASSLRWVNLSTGRDESKLRWSPEERLYDERIYLYPTRRAEVAYHTYHLAVRALSNSRIRRLFMRRTFS